MDIKNLMRQAQVIQDKMKNAQEELAKKLYEGISGGGVVKISITGNGVAKKVFIDKSLLKEEEKDILEDLIVASFNDAKKKADSESDEQIKSLTKGIPLPPGFKI